MKLFRLTIIISAITSELTIQYLRSTITIGILILQLKAKLQAASNSY